MADKKQANACKVPSDIKTAQTTPSKDDILAGEALQECSEGEWDESESAYSADLLNVKKKQDRVTVFAAPEKSFDSHTMSIRPKLPPPVMTSKESEPKDDKLSGLAKLVTGVARQLLDDQNTDGVEVTVSLKVRDRHVKEVKPAMK